MRSRLISSAFALSWLLFALIISAPHARADEDDFKDEGDDYEVTARVARVSLVTGDVNLRRSGDSEWERAQLNFPLAEGDTISTERDARAEIQIDARNFVRLGGDSVLRVVTLRDEGIALSLSEGTATLRLARFDKDKEYFELDAPGTTVAAEGRGLFRLDVRGGGDVRVVTRDGARARIYSESAGFTLRENRSARLLVDGDAAGDWELASAPPFDAWDAWADERERHLASRLRYEDRERYYDREVWGAEELDAYGEWRQTSEYGWVWRPHASVISNYSDWAPYRYGRWVYFPPYGWTWVADEPWGWAPYHYGRWVYHDNYWHWAPRGYGYSYRRAWWRPALVAFVFVSGSRGDDVCWYPLRHGQRDPHSGFWRRNFRRLAELRRHEIRNLHRTNPAYLRAVSSLPSREFGAARRARPADADLARRAVSGDPVVGRLPFARRNPRDGESNGDGRQRTFARPARDLVERPTGATARTPGVALDRELRRARIFNNREPRTPSARDNPDGSRLGRGAGNLGRDSDSDPARDTGAVARPARPPRRTPGDEPRRTPDPTPGARPTPSAEESDKLRERNRIRQPGFRDDDNDGRPDARSGGDNNSARRNNGNEGRRANDNESRRGDDRDAAPRRARPPRSSDESRPDSPAPRSDQRPAPRVFERPEPRPEPRVERPAPREERPAPRQERPAPREERPAPRNDPPPRQEPSRRSEPAPREQPRERPARPAGRDNPVMRDNDN